MEKDNFTKSLSLYALVDAFEDDEDDVVDTISTGSIEITVKELFERLPDSFGEASAKFSFTRDNRGYKLKIEKDSSNTIENLKENLGKIAKVVFNDNAELKSVIPWVLTGSNQFWRTWKGIIVTGNNGQARRFLDNLRDVPAGKRNVGLIQCKLLQRITMKLMNLFVAEKDEAKLRELLDANVSFKLKNLLNTEEAVTKKFWQWSLFCSQSMVRCGLWRTLVDISGGKIKGDTLGSDDDSRAVAYLYSEILKMKVLPKVLPFSWDKDTGKISWELRGCSSKQDKEPRDNQDDQ